MADERIYLTWGKTDRDLSRCESRQQVRDILTDIFPGFSMGKLVNHSGQIWAFVSRMEPGDWVILPSKHKPAVHVGQIKASPAGDYHFNPDAQTPWYHSREVNWFATVMPRTNFDQDILYSLGAFMTICKIQRNDAEARIRAMAEAQWRSATAPAHPMAADDDAEGTEEVPADLEELAQDQSAKLIIAKFKGHGMARLVNAILEAQGYTTHVSPEGPDRGVDILAAPGPMGFGSPRLTMSMKERRRLVVLGQARSGQLTVKSAGELLGLSERRARRLWERFEVEGDGDRVHRLRGRSGNRRVDPADRERALGRSADAVAAGSSHAQASR